MENKQNDIKVLGNHLIHQTFFNKYKLVKKLGEGSFGMIFKAESPEGNFAFKFEKKRPNKRSLLKNESLIMEYLKGKGIPYIKLYVEEENYNIMIMELLGKSLEGLLKDSYDNKLSIKTICLLGIEIIPILKFIHDKHIIHRDIKPDNFAVGSEDPCQVYILDFGLAKKYRSSKTLKQNPMIKHSKLTGTARYASINALKGFEQSRRDDLESLGYVLAYLFRGNLPWQGIAAKTKEEKYAKILNKKENIPPERLLKNEFPELVDYINYCKKLEYEDEPDYNYLSELFKNVLLQKLKETIDYRFDWVNNDAADSHLKLTNASLENAKLETSSMINNINSMTMDKSVNNLSALVSNDKKKMNSKEKMSYYDEVIDEMVIANNDKEQNNKENKENKENKDKNIEFDGKRNNSTRKHGQCCLII